MKKMKLVLQVVLCLALIFCMSSAVSAADNTTESVQPLAMDGFQGQELRNILTSLGVPETISVFVEQYGPYYWEAGSRYYIQVDVYYGKNYVAGAHVDPYTGNLLKNITRYTPTQFSMDDVKPGDWFYNGVKFNYDYALMNGTSRSTFAPETVTSRAMIATILWRLKGSPSAYGNSFNDLTQDWYKTAVTWAAQNGIVEGYGNGKFGPEDPITREQMATMLYRYAQKFTPGVIVTVPQKIYGFNDYSSVSDYAFLPLQWACSEGIITGMPGNIIAPKGNADRAQAATMLERFVRYYYEVE